LKKEKILIIEIVSGQRFLPIKPLNNLIIKEFKK
jgi:hypothetical protein